MLSACANDVGVISLMPSTLQNAKCFARGKVCSLSKDPRTARLQNANMAISADAPEPNHLKAWREFRYLTQEELGALVGTTGSVISLLESGGRKLSPKWLRALAPALQTTPGHLLDHDPNNLPTDMLDIWATIPEEQRPVALRVLAGFAKTGTEG